MTTNRQMGPSEITQFVSLSSKPRKMMADAYNRMRLTARTYYNTIKVAATIADIERSPRVEEEHIAEALLQAEFMRRKGAVIEELACKYLEKQGFRIMPQYPYRPG